MRNVLVAREAYPALREQLVSLKCRAAVPTAHLVFPEWVKNCPATSKALAVAGRTGATRRKFRKMMAAVVDGGCDTWDRFVAKDTDLEEIPLEYKLATPSGNDFIEGYHGTFSLLFDRLGVLANPTRTAMLAMFRHNIGTIEDMGFSLNNVTPELWDAAVQYSRLFKETNLEAQTRVHQTAVTVTIRTKLKKKSAQQIRDECDERAIQYINKPTAILELADIIYEEDHKPE